MRKLALALLAVLVVASGCRMVRPSLVTKTRYYPVYEMRRVPIEGRAGDNSHGKPAYEWRQVRVGLEQREYQVVERHDGANIALTLVALAVTAGLGYGVIYLIDKNCESDAC